MEHKKRYLLAYDSLIALSGNSSIDFSNHKKSRTFNIKSTIMAGLFFGGIFCWPMPLALAYHLYINASNWTILYNIFGVEAFWLAIVGGFFFIMWADQKKIFH